MEGVNGNDRVCDVVSGGTDDDDSVLCSCSGCDVVGAVGVSGGGRGGVDDGIHNVGGAAAGGNDDGGGTAAE